MSVEKMYVEKISPNMFKIGDKVFDKRMISKLFDLEIKSSMSHVHDWRLFNETHSEGGKVYWYCTKCRKTDVKKNEL